MKREHELNITKYENERLKNEFESESLKNEINRDFEMNKAKIQRERDAIFNSFAENARNTYDQIQKSNQERDEREEKQYQKQLERNQKELEEKQKELAVLKEQTENNRQMLDEYRKSQREDDKRHEEKMKELEDDARADRQKRDEEYRKQMQRDEQKYEADRQERRRKAAADALKKDEQRKREFEEWLRQHNYKQQQQRQEHQRKMEEFEEQARIRQQNREKARQANEESKRQFEEHMRFLRERRERMAREQAEQDRLMFERLQAMALADLSQREMQSEFGRICHPIDEQQSAINSAEGLLTNWLKRFSNTAGFLEGVTVSQYNSIFGNRQKKFRLIVNVSNSRHRYSERRSRKMDSTIRRAQQNLDDLKRQMTEIEQENRRANARRQAEIERRRKDNDRRIAERQSAMEKQRIEMERKQREIAESERKDKEEMQRKYEQELKRMKEQFDEQTELERREMEEEIKRRTAEDERTAKEHAEELAVKIRTENEALQQAQIDHQRVLDMRHDNLQYSEHRNLEEFRRRENEQKELEERQRQERIKLENHSNQLHNENEQFARLQGRQQLAVQQGASNLSTELRRQDAYQFMNSLLASAMKKMNEHVGQCDKLILKFGKFNDLRKNQKQGKVASIIRMVSPPSSADERIKKTVVKIKIMAEDILKKLQYEGKVQIGSVKTQILTSFNQVKHEQKKEIRNFLSQIEEKCNTLESLLKRVMNQMKEKDPQVDEELHGELKNAVNELNELCGELPTFFNQEEIDNAKKQMEGNIAGSAAVPLRISSNSAAQIKGTEEN
ncbi:hypothetical protein WR25_02791 isoform A [Diploscapter pachys]|nr:hypothetical protein WR25_02791 isoform A [Diploscapter pachys]